jgi:hypothetical protein
MNPLRRSRFALKWPELPGKVLSTRKRAVAIVALALVATTLTLARRGSSAGQDESQRTSIPNLQAFHDSSGKFATFNTAGDIDTTGPFFQDLGTNGRRCVTCHQPNDAWTVSPEHIKDVSKPPKAAIQFFAPTMVRLVPQRMSPRRMRAVRPTAFS